MTRRRSQRDTAGVGGTGVGCLRLPGSKLCVMRAAIDNDIVLSLAVLAMLLPSRFGLKFDMSALLETLFVFHFFPSISHIDCVGTSKDQA